MAQFFIKNKKDAGADPFTPSIPQYFSWINNTNEGATEEQTLINLEFFEYLRKTYGMQIRLYAWDAGNYDGSREHYGALETEKLRKQYPNGYAPVVAKAAEYGIRLGLWGSPDGFGDDEETEKNRYEFFVHLCRDYHFGLFKLDGVCGQLRPEKAALFAKMLRECREYSPDLIVLNHRLNLYEAEKHVTTFLFNGAETYVDILNLNRCTAMHHRAFMFSRGHVPGLNRLAEDHGVCISSEIDYFEDELIYQAFGRCLILAPEIYGNPWFMRDDELSKLARIYNLHRRNAAILTNASLLPSEYGCDAVTRGNGQKRFICTGNDQWESRVITLELNKLGLDPAEAYTVNLHHPYEKHLGVFGAADRIEIELLPFRAALIEVSVPEKAEIMLPDAEYEIIREAADGTPVEVRLFSGTAENCKSVSARKEQAPRFLAEAAECAFDPVDGEFLYESAMFAIPNDSLERRAVNRSGETAIPEVKAARDAFFGQERYALRGCDSANMFDGDSDSFFDCTSREYRGEKLRIEGGCLRVDFGAVSEADAVEIECFAPDAPTTEVPAFELPFSAEYSEDLCGWKTSAMPSYTVAEDDFTVRVVHYNVHDIYPLKGKKLRITYPVDGKLRYLRIAKPMDRIYSVRLLKNGEALTPVSPFGNIMQAHYRYKHIQLVKTASITLPAIDRPSKLAVAVEGKHWKEQVYCVLEANGKTLGFPERAPDYVACMWEHYVHTTDENNTFFIPVDESLSGCDVKVKVLFTDRDCEDCVCNVYLCDRH